MDAMHDLLEGVVQYEIKELLKHVISERLISLQEINDAIVSFPYGYADVLNKPLPIADITLSSTGHKLKQTGKINVIHPITPTHRTYMFNHVLVFKTASQAWCFARFLPLMIGEKIPEDQPNWLNFLILLNYILIVQLFLKCTISYTFQNGF